jgi:hypothetical protein
MWENGKEVIHVEGILNDFSDKRLELPIFVQMLGRSMVENFA